MVTSLLLLFDNNLLSKLFVSDLISKYNFSDGPCLFLVLEYFDPKFLSRLYSTICRGYSYLLVGIFHDLGFIRSQESGTKLKLLIRQSVFHAEGAYSEVRKW